MSPDAGVRDLLGRILQEEDFRVLLSAGGEAALILFDRQRPDMVLIDLDPARPDAFVLMDRIKQLTDRRFVPILVLVGSLDDALVQRASDAGGDDFVCKPVRPGLLKARLVAMERVRDLHRTQAEKQHAIGVHLERDREEHELAEHLMSHAVRKRNVAMDRLGLIQRPAEIFNGDLVLSQYLPDGGLRVLLGDFTGHGLAAAVGVLPVADAFHAMTRKGMSDLHLLAEINRKLYQLLPADRFMAACLISLPGSGDELRWWNGGMPSAWLRTAGGLTELTAHALPLGILSELPAQEVPRRVHLCGGDRVLLMSDGLLEASDRQGVMFINGAFEGLLRSWRDEEPILPALVAALDAHCRDTEQADDISVLEIPLDPGLLASETWHADGSPRTGWSWSLELRDARLCHQPTLESALRPLGFLDGLERQLGALETILAELFTNALEHGVLRLDSSMKGTPDGFDAYYRERSMLLASELEGWVSIHASYTPTDGGGGEVRIRIQDSGDGFDGGEIVELGADPGCTWGRGIPLLKQLCHSLVFHGNASDAEAVYRF
ncbi:ATP-binding SpoIIE family protein phosphatase [Imhoffiella purpurea]|uniref:ATP-binding SpoIIE family protein phosphatase n=1 Tax=Imhoffiella purpurea TaxID=1249627 RepID=UPI001E55D27B|nr:SpoIIE family protein phosphatase [Imhoffiella purpurea]